MLNLILSLNTKDIVKYIFSELSTHFNALFNTLEIVLKCNGTCTRLINSIIKRTVYNEQSRLDMGLDTISSVVLLFYIDSIKLSIFAHLPLLK